MRQLTKLVGKTIREATLNKDRKEVVVVCDDGTRLVARAQSGPGADSEYYTWTEITLDEEALVNA
ncbi:MAG: hypothetical protein HY457_03505 [Parcubacteria group bacterium]|nr:hypothetical protein [Parcubacteria group bacterium]